MYFGKSTPLLEKHTLETCHHCNTLKQHLLTGCLEKVLLTHIIVVGG